MIGQICYNILTYPLGAGVSNPTTIPNNIDIFRNILPQYPATVKQITKLSITAAPGTKVFINEDKEIIVGRTGVYEVEDVIITSLYFAPVKRYEYNSTESEKLKIQGRAKIKLGIDGGTDPDTGTTIVGIRALTNASGWLLNDTTLAALNDLAINYIEEGYDIYMQGMNGVYTGLTDGDLSNVIIDFIYE